MNKKYKMQYIHLSFMRARITYAFLVPNIVPVLVIEDPQKSSTNG